MQDLGDHSLGADNLVRAGLVRGVGVEDLLLGDEDARMGPEEGEDVGEVVDAEKDVEKEGEDKEAEERLDDASRRGRLWDFHHDIPFTSLDRRPYVFVVGMTSLLELSGWW